jgi:cyanophycinase
MMQSRTPQPHRATRARALFRGVCLLAALLLFDSAADAGERLVIVGGGARPAEALSRFVEWAGKDRARILIIPWATEEPQAAFDSVAKDFAPFRPGTVELAPVAPVSGDARTKFLGQLKSATGVFFTGGDQVRIMNVLKDATLADALRERYRAGIVFGGTSAGTAIMSRRMITGEGDFTVIDARKVETSEGLGLLPEGVIVDQHFIKRQRENRLFGLILQNPEALGLGIDEGTALIVNDNRYAEVVGASQVLMIDGLARKDALTVYMVRPGERIDLLKRKTERPRAHEKPAANHFK